MSELSIKLTQIENTDGTSIKSLFLNGFERYWDSTDLFDPYKLDRWPEYLCQDNMKRMFAIRAAKTSSLNPGKLYVVGVSGFVDIDWISRHGKLIFLMVDKEGHHSTIQNYPATKSAFHSMLDYGFNELGLNRIWIEVYEHNDVKDVLEQFGFVPEGIRTNSFWLKGKYYNSIICSLLKKEYIEKDN